MTYSQLLLAIALANAASASSPAAEPPVPSPDATQGVPDAADLLSRLQTPPSLRPDWTTFRVGGDLFVRTEQRGPELFICGPSRIDTALPVGYPAPTPPGAIELKRYPSVRRAEVSGGGNGDVGRNIAFWPLFNHISKHGIAMTSPVEIDQHTWASRATPAASAPAASDMIPAPAPTSNPTPGPGTEPQASSDSPAQAAEAPAPGGDRQPGWTMSFLYRTPELRQTGQDGQVRIVDTEPVTVVALGMRGPYSDVAGLRGLALLDAWLADQTEWAPAGTPRVMYYNGPDTPRRFAWAEVQIPIHPRSAASPAR